MYYAVIEFDVLPGHEEDFIEAWSELTEFIRKESGGLGSRLHKSYDGRFIAYAQWPDKKTRDQAPKLSEPGEKARERMHKTIKAENTKILMELNSLKDLIVPVTAENKPTESN